MITEFFGVSGVGKSTVARKYYEENKNIEWPRFNLYEKNSWIVRNLKKSIDVTCYFLFHLNWSIKFFKVFENTGIKKLKDKFWGIFNGIHLKYLFTKCINDEKEYIFDEGVFQFIWAIYLRSNELPKKEIVEKLLSLFQMPNKLIIVDAEDEIIKNRLLKRGRKTKILDSADLLTSIAKNKEKLNLIVDYSKEKINNFPCIVEYFDCNKEINK